jgi:hypothetical protein
MLALFLLMQAVVERPAYEPPRPVPSAAPDTATLSLVFADTIDQTDPRPLCARPDCSAMYLGRFKRAQTLAGAPMPGRFSARLEMGSPFISRYRLLLLVERRAGGEAVIRATAGVNYRTGLACLPRADTDGLAWMPAGDAVTVRNGEICAKE